MKTELSYLFETCQILFDNVSGAMTAVNLIHIILFAVIGFIIALVSTCIYKCYKKLLLSLQTFALRYQCNPFRYMYLSCVKTIKKIKSILTKGDSVVTPKRQPKGLVGVIAIDLKSVEGTCLNNGNIKIHFAEDNGDYENRDTRLAENIIKDQCIQIKGYYENLKLPNSRMFKYESIDSSGKIVEQDLCDCFINIYSYDNIQKAIEVVNNDMPTNNAVHFIGDKIGVYGYTIEDGKLKLEIYETDHFTWLVFKEIFKTHKQFFQEVILRINKASEQEKVYLVKLLAFLFSSFGVDIIIEGRDCRKQRKIIISARSGNVESNSKASLHVSVNETFSRTDSKNNSETYSLIECVTRGIEEEIGIPHHLISNDLVKFHDFAIVTDEGEIGLSCHVDLSALMPVEQMLMYPGLDKFLENDELMQLPYFNVSHMDLVRSVDSKRFMRQFYMNTMYDKFSLPWMSFTPLLISRVMLRNIRFSIPVQIILRTILWILSWFIVSWIIIPKLSALLLVEQILGMTVQLMIEAGWNLWNNRTPQKYKFIQPLIAQWGGNVKVLQATGTSAKQIGEVSKELTFDISHIGGTGNVNLNELVLAEAPHCSVRKKKHEDIYTEKPISHYRFKLYDSSATADTLHFISPSIWCEKDKITLVMTFDYEFDNIINENKIKKISFVEELFAKLYISNGGKTLNLNPGFQKNYELLDLFKYENNYFWSCKRPREKDEKYDIYFNISTKYEDKTRRIKSLYDYVLNQIKTSTTNGSLKICVEGDKDVLAQWLCGFTSHRNNLRRISELELYMLQFFLIRNEILLADCECVKPARCCISLR